MSEAPSQPANKRPVIITVICILGFIGCLITLPLLFTRVAADIGAWYPPFVGLTSIVNIVAFIALWRMRLWGLYLYLAMFIVAQAVMMATHIWYPVAVVLPIVIIIIGFSFRSRMR